MLQCTVCILASFPEPREAIFVTHENHSVDEISVRSMLRQPLSQMINSPDESDLVQKSDLCLT